MRWLAPALALVAVVGAAAAPARAGSPPLVTGVSDPVLLSRPGAAVAFRRIHAAGATTTRLVLTWSAVAPPGASPPKGFDATNPSDPHYRWAAFDREVKLAVAAGLEPIVDITGAPRWAQAASIPSNAGDAPYQPSPAAYGTFAAAAAARYGGKVPGLPVVRYWEAWNEPNISTFLMPQVYGNDPRSPAWYRAMVNAFAAAVHGVSSKNLVIAGAVAPFRDAGVSNLADWGPLAFMRSLFCLDDKLRPTCSDTVAFDVWSFHPYTSGGPEHHANLPNDVSLGDVPELRAVVRAAQRAHHIVAPHGVGLWVTEFSWDSAPPDPQAVPMDTLRRWIPEALYQLWRNGVTHVMWFQLVDLPMSSSPFQSGLWFAGGHRAKPILANFRFPVVVLTEPGGVRVWGRTPWGRPGPVRIQTFTARGWTSAGLLTANRNGVFAGKIHPPGAMGDRARAVAAGGPSGWVPTAPVPDHFYNPFGTTPPLESH